MDIPEFPSIHARNLSAAQQKQNLEMLQYISQAATDHGIDFTLGIWQQNIQSYRRPPMVPMTVGLTRENIGPYTYAALKKVLQLCPAIASVQMRTNNETGIPNENQVTFYGKYVFRAFMMPADRSFWIFAVGNGGGNAQDCERSSNQSAPLD